MNCLFRLGKVAVRDRAMVTTTDAERKVVTPALRIEISIHMNEDNLQLQEGGNP